MSETEPIHRHPSIIVIDANNKIAYIAITRSTDRAAWSALTVE